MILIPPHMLIPTRLLSIAALALLPGAAMAQKQVVIPQGTNASATLSPAVRIGDLLYLSGQLPARGDSTIEGQTKSALEKMNPILAAAGTSSANIVKCTVFLVDVKDFAGMNKAYAEFFPEGAAGALHGRRRGTRVPGRETRGRVHRGGSEMTA